MRFVLYGSTVLLLLGYADVVAGQYHGRARKRARWGLFKTTEARIRRGELFVPAFLKPAVAERRLGRWYMRGATTSCSLIPVLSEGAHGVPSLRRIWYFELI